MQESKTDRKIMTHASLFSGIGAAELAATWMGWKNLFHCDINEYGNRVLNYWYPESKGYKDVKETNFTEWRGKVDVLTAGFPCFEAGTHIMTSEGFKNIENISLGDLILTKEGRYMPCNTTMNKITNEIIGIRAQGLYKPMITTSNHPFFVKRKKESKASWVNAGDIKKGDMIAYRCINGNLKSKDANYWYMVGRFLGDGWILDGKRKSKIEKGHKNSRINSFNHKVVICCNKKEDEILKSIILNAGYKYTFSSERTVDKFIICNQKLESELKNFGRYSYGKKLSKESFQLEFYRKKALFEGWLSANGYINKNGSYKITTVSEELAIGMATIARDVYKCPVSISKKTINRICKIEGRIVNERPQFCVTVSNCNKFGYYEDGFVWCLVKKVFKETKKVKVYNIGVLEDETYTANGITVHNCQPFSNAGKRKGTDDNRYLWPETIRVIREVRPTWFIGENVAGILSMVQPGKETAVAQTRPLFGESNTIYEKRERYVVETICSDLEKEGYSVQPFNIPACGVGAPHKRERIWFIASRNTSDTTSMGRKERRANCKGQNEDEENRANLFLKSERSCQEQSASGTTCNGYLSQGKSEGAEKEKRFISQPDKRGNTAEWSDELSIFQQYNSSEEYREGQKKRMLEKSFIPAEIWSDFPTVAPVCRGNDGIPFDLSALAVSFPKWRQETITALGNSMVPEVVYEIFRAIQIASETEL